MSVDVNDLEATGDAPEEPTLPTQEQPLQVYKLPDASTVPVFGGIYEWISNENDSGLWHSQAKCYVILDEGVVEHFSSKIFILRRDCDPVMQDPMDSKNPYAVLNMSQSSRDAVIASAAVARHGMNWQTERSPQDMHRELNEIRSDAAASYRKYELELGRIAKQRLQDAKDIETFESAERGRLLVEARKDTVNES